jgi:hypothetical protein
VAAGDTGDGRSAGAPDACIAWEEPLPCPLVRLIEASFEGTGGFDRIEISAVEGGLFTVDGVNLGNLYAEEFLL